MASPAPAPVESGWFVEGGSEGRLGEAADISGGREGRSAKAGNLLVVVDAVEVDGGGMT